MSSCRERVGIVGVGRMRLVMVKHLVKHGYPVAACDINADNVNKARGLGAAAAATPAALGKSADFVILCVGYEDEVNRWCWARTDSTRQVGKAMNNLLLWITSIGLIEAGRIAETTGINLSRLREALMMSSGKSQALEDWDQTSFTWA